MKPSSIDVTSLLRYNAVEEAARAIRDAYNFERHPYFFWIRHPTTTLEDFRKSQIPFVYAVEYFSQPLAAVLARTPSVQDRLQTVFENVGEEHGFGDFEKCHRATFVSYLKSLGVPDHEVESNPCPTRVAAFTEALLNFCLVNPPDKGGALLGIIEYLYVKISQLLIDTIRERS